MVLLKTIKPDELPSDCFEPVDPKALEQAKTIVNEIKAGGETAFLKWATKFGDVKQGESYVALKDELKAAYDGLPEENRALLSRVVHSSLNLLHTPQMSWVKLLVSDRGFGTKSRDQTCIAPYHQSL